MSFRRAYILVRMYIGLLLNNEEFRYALVLLLVACLCHFFDNYYGMLVITLMVYLFGYGLYIKAIFDENNNQALRIFRLIHGVSKIDNIRALAFIVSVVSVLFFSVGIFFLADGWKEGAKGLWLLLHLCYASFVWTLCTYKLNQTTIQLLILCVGWILTMLLMLFAGKAIALAVNSFLLILIILIQNNEKHHSV